MASESTLQMMFRGPPLIEFCSVYQGPQVYGKAIKTLLHSPTAYLVFSTKTSYPRCLWMNAKADRRMPLADGKQIVRKRAKI